MLDLRTRRDEGREDNQDNSALLVEEAGVLVLTRFVILRIQGFLEAGGVVLLINGREGPDATLIFMTGGLQMVKEGDAGSDEPVEIGLRGCVTGLVGGIQGACCSLSGDKLRGIVDGESLVKVKGLKTFFNKRIGS